MLIDDGRWNVLRNAGAGTWGLQGLISGNLPERIGDVVASGGIREELPGGGVMISWERRYFVSVLSAMGWDPHLSDLRGRYGRRGVNGC